MRFNNTEILIPKHTQARVYQEALNTQTFFTFKVLPGYLTPLTQSLHICDTPTSLAITLIQAF